MSNKRIIGLDVVRVCAIFFVISVHFFLNSEFNQLYFNNISTFILTCLRWLFFTCIGLFLLLTGFLNKNTHFNRKYVYKLFKVLISYLIIGVICLFFKKFYLNEDITFVRGIINLFNFSANDYAWYVEMYCGLFLIIPFLNILYDNLKTKENKLKLLGVLLVMFSLTSTFKFFYPSVYTINAFSDYWVAGYPVLYFFLGKFLSEFSLKMSRKKLLFMLIFILVFKTGLLFIFNFGQTFPMDIFSGYAGGYYNLFTVLEVVLLFSILVNTKLKNNLFIKAITSISFVSFEMYLFSAVVDKFYYSNIDLQFGNLWNYLINYLISVTVVFIVSYMCALLINKFSRFIYKNCKIIYDLVCDFFGSKFIKIWEALIK